MRATERRDERDDDGIDARRSGVRAMVVLDVRATGVGVTKAIVDGDQKLGGRMYRAVDDDWWLGGGRKCEEDLMAMVMRESKQ